MKKLRLVLNAWCLVLGAGAALAGEVRMAQTVTLQPGWGLFPLFVTPDEAPEEFFRDWPISKVGEYDAAALRTAQQFSSEGSSEGATVQPWKMYVPGDPGATRLAALAANRIYLAFNTNATAFTKTFYGAPRAARMSLHATGENVLNYAFFSLTSSVEKVSAVGYFDGLDAGRWTAYAVYGKENAPRITPLSASETFASGAAIALASAHATDWSGTFFVSPAEGIDFGTSRSMAELSIRNDASAERTVRLSIERAHSNETKFVTFATNYLVRSAAVVGPGSDWRNLTLSTPYECAIPAGKTLTLRLAFDRPAYAHLKKGTRVGALLHIDAADGASGFRTTIPIEATADRGTSDPRGWTTGTWLTDLALDRVSFIKSDGTGNPRQPVLAGGVMKARLLLCRDPGGAMTLLPRIEDGRMRVSSAVIPTDAVSIGTTDSGEVFGESAHFHFVVSEKSRVNPFFHAQHPDHDGLASDFASPAPSGDDPANYLNAVKPELFSVQNDIELVWDPVEGTAWSPEERLAGTVRWTFGGLRRQGEIETSGTFSMRRISDYYPQADTNTNERVEQ